MLFDQRDEAIRQLSEKMEVRTVTQPNGSMLVNMSTGHSLVLDGGVAQFKVVPGSPDSRDARLQLTLGANQANINDKDLGGRHRRPLHARATDLEPAKRELGQLAVAMADAMNQQNRLGMDLDNELGGISSPSREARGCPMPATRATARPASTSFPARGQRGHHLRLRGAVQQRHRLRGILHRRQRAAHFARRRDHAPSHLRGGGARHRDRSLRHTGRG